MNNNNMDYSQILNTSVDSLYDYTNSSHLLLEWLKESKLTKDECIKIINDFSNKYQPGEEYGGGYPCDNTDCHRDYTSDYFVELKNFTYCPSCCSNEETDEEDV